MPKLIELPTKKNTLDVRNKTETVAEILLYGPIGESPWDDSYISAKQFADALKKIPESVKTIELRVNSPGGSVFDGMTIYERLKGHKAKVIAYVDGMAASIASIIIMAADEIIMGEGAQVMIHKPMTGVYGNAREMESIIDVLDKIESQMIGIYTRRTGISRAELIAAVDKETWYTAEEAMELGFADKISAYDQTMQIAASAMAEDCKWFKNRPQFQNKNALVRQKLKEFNNSAKQYLAR